MSMQNAGSIRLKEIILVYLRRMRWQLGLAGLCLLGVIATELAAPWPIKIIFDYILLAKPLPGHLGLLAPLLESGTLVAITVLSGTIFLMVVIGGGLSYFQLYITAKVGHQLTYSLRRELFSRLQQLSLAFHSQSRSAELLMKVAGDTTALKDLFSDWALTTAAHLLLMSGMLIIMVLLNWQLSLVVLVTLPVLFGVLFRLNRKVAASARSQRRQEGRMASRINEVLSSISLVQAFGRQSHEEARFDVESAQNLEEGIRTSRTTAAVAKTIALVSAAGTAVTVLFGSWQVVKGRMSPGDLLVFMAYLRSLYKPIRDLGKMSVKFSRTMVSANRIGEILAVDPDIRDRPDAIVAGRLAGNIVFDRVSFAYPNGPMILDDVSFAIRPGQRVALVGASGAGKSTIVNLVLRLYEANAGAVVIDGVDVKHYQRESLRREIGIILQDTVLFGASVRENIAYGKPDATPEEIEQAARDARAHDFIVTLPDGYDTILGERGGTLSGGQRQRICLARAIIKRPSILILDEPTSAVDQVSAALIGEAVRRIQAGKTTLVIAHQFSTMHEFDQILVIKEGRIIEAGRHQELLGADGHYRELIRMA